MSESELHRWIIAFELLLAATTAGVLLFVTAPYGRHRREGWGPTLCARAGWCLMELPAVLVFLVVFALGKNASEPAPMLLLIVWQVHYVDRALLFPLRLRASGQRMPWIVVVLGMAFNSLNAYLNARWISHLGEYRATWLSSAALWFGLTIFFIGLCANRWSDAKLIALRQPRESGYRIPRGGLYRWVSCPNYLAEIVQWCGWAMATWSAAGAAFAVYTVANLAPRALHHHRWYRQQVPDYPPLRRALVPFLF